MPESDDSFSFAKARDTFESKLSSDLAETFNQVAKLAMQASAEFSDGSNDMKVLQKIQKAHRTVTLIMDDAMRGLNEATASALSFAVTSGLSVDEDE